MNPPGPIETTEWSDIQYKFGNKVGKYADPVMEQKILEQRIRKIVEDAVESYDPNQHKTLADVEEEMEDAYDDDRELERLRQQRIAELQRQSGTPTYGRVHKIERSDYVAEVTNAGKGIPVVLLLMQPNHSACLQLRCALDACASKYSGTKFLEIISTECIPGFPDRQLPCVIFYRDGELQKQVTGLAPWGGERFTAEDVAYELHKAKMIVDPDMAETDSPDDGAARLSLKNRTHGLRPDL